MASIDSLDELLRDFRELARILEPLAFPGERLSDTARRMALEVADLKRRNLLATPAGSPPVRSNQIVPASPLAGYRTVRQIVETCPAITRGGLKWMLFHRQTNGLATHVISAGRKILIDEAGFLSWLRDHRG